MEQQTEEKLKQKDLVIGIASSALFDLSESDKVYREQGVKAYADYQNEHSEEPLSEGPAFPFISRLLEFNQFFQDSDTGGVEVIVMSRNSPQTGLRVMKSIEHHNLGISRAIFRSGKASSEFMKVLNMSLFLSGNADDVEAAMSNGDTAGYVLPKENIPPAAIHDLCVAFDFDGVLAGDSADRKFAEMQESNPNSALADYQQSEKELAKQPIELGPLAPLLRGLNKLQKAARSNTGIDLDLRISLVTARNGYASERAVRTLEHWGLTVDDAFFLGGLDKTPILNQLKPDIFFDNEMKNLQNDKSLVPLVYIPFGNGLE